MSTQPFAGTDGQLWQVECQGPAIEGRGRRGNKTVQMAFPVTWARSSLDLFLPEFRISLDIQTRLKHRSDKIINHSQ